MKYLFCTIVAISLAVGNSAFGKGAIVSQSTLDRQGSGQIKSCSLEACVKLQLSRGYKNPQDWCPQNIGRRRGACP